MARRKAARSSRRAASSAAHKARKARSAMLVAWTMLGLAACVCVALGWVLLGYPSTPGPGSGRAVDLTLPPDMGPGELSAELAAQEVLSHPLLFALWARLTGGVRDVVPGEHLLTDDATPREILARLERRGAGTIRVTFPEGWTRFDMARRLDERHVVALRWFLQATTDPELLATLGIGGESAEGYLFPATYDLPFDSDARDVVRRMKREFDKRFGLLASSRAASLTDIMTSTNLTPSGVVTLASMVEKEAAVDDERPVIASVFLNRLRDPTFHPKHLECDPTAAYGCLVHPESAPSCADFSGKPTAAIEHDSQNPYSTYTHEGLPPGPIANPGAKSLEAVMVPALTHYYFFVAKGEGRHTFSETYESHVAAVRDPASRPTAGFR